VTVLDQATVADILMRWPEVARVFVRRGMACVGCAMAPFETLAEAAGYYGIPPNVLRAEVEAAVALALGAEDQEGLTPDT